jgi:hypothetical protein
MRICATALLAHADGSAVYEDFTKLYTNLDARKT